MRQVDGSNVLVKITTIPRGTNSRGSIGPSDLPDYTIQADFKIAAAANGKLPDVGVIAQGYTLEVSGENNWLKLLSWGAHDKRHVQGAPVRARAQRLVHAEAAGRQRRRQGPAARQALEARRKEPDGLDHRADRSGAQHATGPPACSATRPTPKLYFDNVSVISNSAN